MSEQAQDFTKQLIIDGTKVGWYQDRVLAWKRGEKIAPITIDYAMTRECQAACVCCYAMLQENERKYQTKEVVFNFLDDCAEIGVDGVLDIGIDFDLLERFPVKTVQEFSQRADVAVGDHLEPRLDDAFRERATVVVDLVETSSHEIHDRLRARTTRSARVAGLESRLDVLTVRKRHVVYS